MPYSYFHTLTATLLLPHSYFHTLISTPFLLPPHPTLDSFHHSFSAQRSPLQRCHRCSPFLLLTSISLSLLPPLSSHSLINISLSLLPLLSFPHQHSSPPHLHSLILTNPIHPHSSPIHSSPLLSHPHLHQISNTRFFLLPNFSPTLSFPFSTFFTHFTNTFGQLFRFPSSTASSFKSS